jgi:hypothetical protein
MKNLHNDTEQAGVQTTLFLLEDFLVNHTQPLESDLEMKMIATSGRRCLESYGRFARHGSWARMFSALLIGMTGWCSTRCRLTWKLKGTRYNRMYFQLQVSERPTDEIGFGLLRTPNAQEPGVTTERLVTKDGEPAKIGARAYDKHTGRLAQVGLTQQVKMGLLPTPETSQGGANKDVKISPNGNYYRKNSKGVRYGPRLQDVVASGLLPTPTVMDMMNNPRREITPSGRIISNQGHNGSAPLKDLAMNGMLQTPILENSEQTGETSQLNPPFVAEMMGFPPNWLELPFLSTETSL